MPGRLTRMNASWNGRHAGASIPSRGRSARATARLAAGKRRAHRGHLEQGADPALDPIGGDPREPQQLLGRLASASR